MSVSGREICCSSRAQISVVDPVAKATLPWTRLLCFLREQPDRMCEEEILWGRMEATTWRGSCWTCALLTFALLMCRRFSTQGAHLVCFCQHAQTLAKNDVDTATSLFLARMPPARLAPAQAADSILCHIPHCFWGDTREICSWHACAPLSPLASRPRKAWID